VGGAAQVTGQLPLSRYCFLDPGSGAGSGCAGLLVPPIARAAGPGGTEGLEGAGAGTYDPKESQ
jgi:hypothetical protein